MAVFCNRCGTGLPGSARFCSSCGAVVPAMQAPAGSPLMRPRVGRQIAGVCLAIAQANGWEATTVRVLTVLAFFFSSGLIGVAYLACWIGIPEEPLDASAFPGAYPPQV